MPGRRALQRYRDELPAALATVALGAVLALAAPGYYAPDNLRDLLLANLPVLVVAIGAALVILSGEIDISSGSMFAVCAVLAGTVAKATGSLLWATVAATTAGLMLGLLNGVLVSYVRIPSIVVTLATMVALRDGLRWVTQGTWVQDLPREFQWFGLTQQAYPWIAVIVSMSILVVTAWALGNLAAGRAIYATGSNTDAARLAGIHVPRVKCTVFAIAGALTGIAALLNAVRFNQIPSNTGLGLEMKVIAAAVVGGAAITGGRGTMLGTLLGVVLLGAIGPALTFLGVTAYWERALQGLIILAAIALHARRDVRDTDTPPAAASRAVPA
jgi:rhamnose transport system permease protein